MKEKKYIGLGRLALAIGAYETALRRLCTRRPERIPHMKIGRMRVFAEDDIPAIREACVEFGLIKPEVVGVANAPI